MINDIFFESEMMLVILCCFCVYCWLVFAIKYLVVDKVNLKSKINALANILLSFISIDYLITKFIKKRNYSNQDTNFKENDKSNESDDNKRKLSKFIKKSNHINLFISLVLLIIACIFNLTPLHSSLFTKCLNIFIWIRFISRSFEVIISFVFDIIDEKKKSDLSNKERMGLAILSLIEIFVLCSACILFKERNIVRSMIFTIDSIFMEFCKSMYIHACQLIMGISFISLITLYLSTLIQINNSRQEKNN